MTGFSHFSLAMPGLATREQGEAIDAYLGGAGSNAHAVAAPNDQRLMQ